MIYLTLNALGISPQGLCGSDVIAATPELPQIASLTSAAVFVICTFSAVISGGAGVASMEGTCGDGEEGASDATVRGLRSEH